MKNMIKWGLATVAASAMLVSCTGRIVEIPSPVVQEDRLVLTADTYAINADGADEVFFTVTLNGEDVTSLAEIKNFETHEALPEGEAWFTSTETGQVTFVATYSVESEADVEELTSNTQTVKVIDEDAPKTFYRKCGIVRFTGTWCAPCYVLGQTFNSAVAQFPDRTVMIMVHVNNVVNPDPYINEATESARIDMIGGEPIPQIFFDFRNHIAQANIAESTIVSYLTNSIEDHPADCGIAASSTISGSTATIDVEVTSTSGGEYFLTVALLEDGIIGEQTDGDYVKIKNYSHNNTLRSFGETSVYGKSLGNIAEGAIETMQLSYDLSEYNAENCRFAIFVTYKDEDDGKFYVDNAAYCPADGSIRISYDA